MGFFDFLKVPMLDHPRFGEMKFSRNYWRCEAEYLGAKNVHLMLRGDRKQVDPSAQDMCDDLETRFASLKDEIGKALYDESYIPVREAIDAGTYPEDVSEEVPRIQTPADVWKHLRPAWIMFKADGEPGHITIAVETEWEIEHTLGIGIRNWRYNYLNGSVIPV